MADTGLGIAGFEEIVGSIRKDSDILVVGPPGSGKSYLGYQFLYMGALIYGEPGVIISFDESVETIRNNAKARGINFDDLEKDNMIKIGALEPLEIQRFAKQESIVIADMLYAVNAKRVFIDSIDSYEVMFSSSYNQRIMDLKLLKEVHRRSCTTMVASLLGGSSLSKYGNVDVMADTIFRLGIKQKSERMHRTFEVVKMRDRKHPLGEMEMVFGSEGIELKCEKGAKDG